MKKIAIVTDSNSGITQEESQKLGVIVIPMPFYINDEEYFEDINLTSDKFYEMLIAGADVKTSQPSIASILDCWNEMLKKYDEIVYIPMSSGLSASYQTAFNLAKEYDGRVAVVNNQRVSVTLRKSVIDALELSKKGFNCHEICEILEKNKFESSIYIMMNELKYLKKGGRITPAAATIGTVLNLKPVLQIQGEKLDAYAKCRGVKAGKKKLLDAIDFDLKNRFKSAFENNKISLFISHTQNDEEALQLKKELENIYTQLKPIIINPLSLSIACHIGPGSLAIACSVDIDELA